MTENISLYAEHINKLLSFYDKVLADNNFNALVIPSGEPKQQFLDDNYYPFKVNVHFKALLPIIDAPHSYIIYLCGHKPTLVFYQPKDYWHVVPSDPKGDWIKHFEIKIVSDKDSWKTMLPKDTNQTAWLGEHQQVLNSANIKNVNPKKLLNSIHYNRAIKSEYEIDCLRKANLIAAKGHLAAKEAFYQGASEFEIHLSYLKATNQTEEQLPYGNIIALNEHGSVLHYTDLKTIRFDKNNLHSFLIDAGATYQGYFSDITRTWSYHTNEFNELIKRFDLLQQEILQELHSGICYVELHISCHLKIAKLLKEVGFVLCDPDTAVETGISNTFFAHGLGHLLGLQVHDIAGHQINDMGEIKPPPEAYPALRLTRKLEKGFCITIEPGLYFINLLLDRLAATKYASMINWPMVEAFKKYGGIRIEDDVIITKNGFENLTRDAFAQIN